MSTFFAGKDCTFNWGTTTNIYARTIDYDLESKPGDVSGFPDRGSPHVIPGPWNGTLKAMGPFESSTMTFAINQTGDIAFVLVGSVQVKMPALLKKISLHGDSSDGKPVEATFEFTASGGFTATTLGSGT